MVLYGPRKLSGPPCYWRPGILIGWSSSKRRVGQGWQGEGQKKKVTSTASTSGVGGLQDFELSSFQARLPEMPARKGRTSRACRLEVFTLPVIWRDGPPSHMWWCTKWLDDLAIDWVTKSEVQPKVIDIHLYIYIPTQTMGVPNLHTNSKHVHLH